MARTLPARLLFGQEFGQSPEALDYNARVTPMDRPGLKKARVTRLPAERAVRLWQCSDPLAIRLLASADVMSEGATRSEGSRSVYYGTTSIVLPVVSKGGHIPDESLNDSMRWCRADPHLRVRVLRLARREAAQRAGAVLGRMEAELRFVKLPKGLRIDVEVEAAVAVESLRRHA